MSKEYHKKCSNCGSEIIMSLTDSGKWQPMETDNATIHRCMKREQIAQATQKAEARVEKIERVIKSMLEAYQSQ